MPAVAVDKQTVQWVPYIMAFDVGKVIRKHITTPHHSYYIPYKHGFSMERNPKPDRWTVPGCGWKGFRERSVVLSCTVSLLIAFITFPTCIYSDPPAVQSSKCCVRFSVNTSSWCCQEPNRAPFNYPRYSAPPLSTSCWHHLPYSYTAILPVDRPWSVTATVDSNSAHIFSHQEAFN